MTGRYPETYRYDLATQRMSVLRAEVDGVNLAMVVLARWIGEGDAVRPALVRAPGRRAA